MAEFKPYQAEYQHALEEAGTSSVEELVREVAHLEQRIHRTKSKLAAAAAAGEEGGAVGDKVEEVRCGGCGVQPGLDKVDKVRYS